MSAPPSSAPPPAPAGVGREHVLALEASRGWARRRAEDGLRLTPTGATLVHDGLLRTPLHLPLNLLQLGLVERGGARSDGATGRFPVLRRLTASAVIPREQGVEGWLWTSASGSALTVLGDEDAAPNAALLLTMPLGPDRLEPCMQPSALAALAARSPLGVPAIPGFLFRVADAGKAEAAFRAYGLLRPLTDREVPPVMRRSLPSDRPPDPTVSVRGGTAARSVPPPGFPSSR